jgi:ribosomal protein L30E
MTAKEKAKELIEFYKFGNHTVYNWTLDKLEITGPNNKYYKICALKLVDEIINEVRIDYNEHQWYRQVKQEIEKL